MKKKKALILGAAGSIGSELTRQLAKDYTCYVVDINETGIFELREELGVAGRIGDIRNKETMNDVFSDFKPDIVYHCAAYKHVPLGQEIPDEVIATNIGGTQNVLRYAQIWEVPKLVFISTDKAVSPKTVMGKTKSLGEDLTLNAGYTVVRFGNVLNSRGSLIPIWQKQADEGKPITVTDKRMTRYFMTIEDAVRLVIDAHEHGNAIVVLDMGEKINIAELAEQIIKGKDISIQVTGKRPGEQLTEETMWPDERERAVKKDKYYIIK